MSDESMTYADFAKREGITMTVEPWHENPNMPDWRDADHYRLTFKRGRKRMTVYYSMGYGHNGRHPETGDVLETLWLDADCLNYTFEEWSDNIGWDPDSRKGERTYKACRNLSEKLRQFIGADGWERLATVTA